MADNNYSMPEPFTEMERLSIENITDVPEKYLGKANDILDNIRVTADCNLLYYQCFSLLQLAGLSAEIPRLVVFGQQSMGKTTLLDYIMGGPVGYSSTETGTKQPVLITITPSDDGSTSCLFDGQRMELAHLQDAMSAKMISVGDQILSKELSVQVFIPGSVHAIFVDLPGIKDDSKVGADLTRRVVKEYVQRNPNDIYILVKKASDDPANWPWYLRDFVLSPAPRGLGLNREQTIVVGTRAKEFLMNEKSDIRNQQQLLERVIKRAVTDTDGAPMKLFLLELFSLPVEMKSLSFLERKKEMQKQINSGYQEVVECLNYFASTTPEKRQQLFDYFNYRLFKTALNSSFQKLLNNQLKSLEKRIRDRTREIERNKRLIDQSLEQLNPTAFKGNIKTFIRELTSVVTGLLDGRFTVVKLSNKGIDFLNQFGGTLYDNLFDGHELAMELFSSEEYDYECLERYVDQKHITAKKEKVHVRYLTKKNMYMYGTIKIDEKNYAALHTSSGQDPVVSFYSYNIESGKEQFSQERVIDKGRISVIKPLASLANKISGKQQIKCWHKSIFPDSWVGLTPVTIIADSNNSPDSELKIEISADNEDSEALSVTLESLFIDESLITLLVSPDSKSESKASTPKNAKGENQQFQQLSVKLLNKVPFNDLSIWLNSQMKDSHPDIYFSPQVEMQMMRSVHLVIDKSAWEPLVADILQANVHRNLVNLSILVSCAAAVALRRVIKAACYEMRRRANSGELKDALFHLINNRVFMDDLDVALENYCRNKARECVNSMQREILGQTYAIRFDVIDQFFSACSSYETEFLNSKTMVPVVEAVRKNLAQRDSFPVALNGQLNLMDPEAEKFIMREVKMQYWVTKILLSSTLSTKVYVHFLKELLDKSEHLAANFKSVVSCETLLELELQQALLSEKNGEDTYAVRSDEALMAHYDMLQELDVLTTQQGALGRVHKFLGYTMEGVSKLRSQTLRENGVDFLMRLGVDLNPTQQIIVEDLAEHASGSSATSEYASSNTKE